MVIKVGADGTARWLAQVAGAGPAGEPPDCRGLAIDPNGDVFVVGSFVGGLGGVASKGGRDSFVAKLSGLDGKVQALHGIGHAQDDTATNVIAGSYRDVLVSYELGSPHDFGGGPVATAGLVRFELSNLAYRETVIGVAGNTGVVKSLARHASGEIFVLVADEHVVRRFPR